MTISLVGKVFYDINHTGVYDPDYPGIPNVCILLTSPTNELISTQTTCDGSFRFSLEGTCGEYIITEIVTSTDIEFPYPLPHPGGTTSSTTPRQYKFTLFADDLKQDILLDYFHFGHDFSMPFECTDLIYSLSNLKLTGTHIITGNVSPLFTLPIQGIYNLLDFNPVDNYIYGYAPLLNQIFRLSADESITFFSINSLPHKDFKYGAFTQNGHLYLYDSLDGVIYVVDINCFSASYLSLLNTIDFTYAKLSAFCFNPAYEAFYGIDTEGQILSWTFSDMGINSLNTLGTPSKKALLLVCDYSGYLYSIFENSSTIYKITLTNNSAYCEFFTNLSTSWSTRGVKCQLSPVHINLGCASDHYKTTALHNGPRHGTTNLLSMHCLSQLIPLYIEDTIYSIELYVTNSTTSNAYLYGWIDYNHNGIFEHSESLDPITITKETIGPITVDFNIPQDSSIHLGKTFIRLRLTTDTLADIDCEGQFEDTRSLGPASDGIVLDFPIEIITSPPIAPHTPPISCEYNQPYSTTCSFIDPAHSNLTYCISSPTHHGVIDINPNSGLWTYIPESDYFGTDSFTICATSTYSSLSSELPISLLVQSARLCGETTASHTECLLGDTLTYTTIITNTGNTVINHIKYYHPLPEGISFKSSSVMINSIKSINDHPEYGIEITSLDPGKSCTVSFQIALISPSQAFSSQGTLHFNCVLVECNLVNGFIRNPSLELSLDTSFYEAFSDDSIYYIAKIHNSGDIILKDISLILTLPLGVSSYNTMLLPENSPISNLDTGYILPLLCPGEHIYLSFNIQCKDICTSLIKTILFASCTYTLNNQTTQLKNISISHTLPVIYPELKIIKSSSKSSLTLQEDFLYTMTIINNSPLYMSEVLIQEYIPSNFYITEIYYDNIPLPNFLSSGLCLGPLLPNTEAKLTITLKAIDISSKNCYHFNPTLATFKCLRESPDETKSFSIEAPPLDHIYVALASLELVKTPSTLEAAIDEIIKYSITLINTGTLPVKNLTLYDLLSSEIKFISESLLINNTYSPSGSPISGIHIDSLDPGNSITISFDALVINKGCGTLQSTCSAYYTYTPPLCLDAKSGYVSTVNDPIIIRQPHLQISASTDSNLVYIGDELEYKVNLLNSGDVDLFNITLVSNLVGCTLIEGSFTLNNQVIRGIHLPGSIHIGVLAVGEHTTLNYKVLVTGESIPNSTVTHSYTASFTYNTVEHYTRWGTTQEINLTTPIALSTFKSLLLDNYLDIPDLNLDIDEISSIDGQVSLIKHYIINTPQGTSAHHLTLTGKKLIVHGMLNLTVEYTAIAPQSPLHSMYYSIPFTTFIILPNIALTDSSIYLEPIIDTINYKALSTRSFFTTSSFLLVAHIQ